MAAKLTTHSFAEIFPRLPMEEFDQLVHDIRLHGLRDPIVLFEGQILDGRNRYDACLLAGVAPRFRQYDPAHGDPLDYVMSVNYYRRHLDPSQRGLAGARFAKLRQGRPKQPTATGGNPPQPTHEKVTPSSCFPDDKEKVSIETFSSTRPADSANDAKTVAEAAAAMDVGRSTILRARKVLEHGTAELVEAVEKGELSVNDAEQVSKYAEDIQREAVRAKRAGQARTASAAAHKAARAKKKAAPREPGEHDERCPADGTPLVDELGNEVPEESRAAFAEREAFQAAGRKLDAVRREIASLVEGPAGHYLRMELQSITHALQQAKAQLIHSMPYSIAPGKPNAPKWLSNQAYKQQAGVRYR